MAEQYRGILDPIGGDDNGNDPAIVDPGTAAGSDSNSNREPGGSGDYGTKRDGTPRRKPGRKSGGGGTGSSAGSGGSAGRGTSSKASLDIDGVSALLVLIHKAVAERSQVRDENGILIWEITNSEGDALAKAANNVIRHYDIAASQKMIDIGAAVTVAMAVYLPRVAATVESKQRAMPTAHPTAAAA